MIVACNDDPLLRRLLPEVQRRTVTYGTKRGSDFLIKLDSALRDSGTGSKPMSRFQVSYGKTGEKKNNLGEFTLHVPGVHNILNATAAIAVGVGLDIGVDAIRHALDQFRGVDRRFQLKGQAAGVSVIDDYGHHPTEIKATLAAARSCGFKKVHVIFQPHRYTRTRDLMEDFTTAFNDADTLFVLDIYAASEKPIEGISGQDLAHRIREKTEKHVEYAESFTDAIASSVEAAHDGDMILTLGAGSVSQLGPMILDKLKERDRATGEL
jgi:UDP-N-acetylmuramate--alanine ligase